MSGLRLTGVRWLATIGGLLIAGAAGAADLEFTVRLDPATRLLEVEGRVRLRAGTRSATFALAPRFALGRFAVGARETAASRSPAGDWTVPIPREDTAATVEMAYHGILDTLVDSQRADQSGAAAFADLRGSFVSAQALWLPTVNEERSSYRLTLDLPAGQRALVPGRLISEAVVAGRYRATFAAQSEAGVGAGSAVLMAGPYEVRERSHRGIRLRTYFVPEVAELAESYLKDVARYIDLYDRWIGTYPYSAFHVVSAPLPVGLGFPNLTYIGTRVLRLPFIRGTSLGHEVAHSWWGNGVHPDFARGNWSEGLTTFMADYTYALQRSPVAAREQRLQWLRDFKALPAERDIMASEFVSRRHDAAQIIGYYKVAFVFHMLREEIGADAFDRGIRALWAQFRYRIAGWPDLRQVFEQSAGRDLDQFFAQWIERRGAPALELGEARVVPATDRFKLIFSLRQPAPVYALQVPVRVWTAAGRRDFDVAMDGPQATIELDLAARPVRFAVDPDFDLFRRLAPGEASPIIRDVTLDTATRVLLVDQDPTAREAAARLAARMLDVAPVLVETDADTLPDGPLLIIGTASRVGPLMASAGLPATPSRIAGQGTARAWASRTSGQRPVVVVTADSAAGLAALVRPLPHYGRRGFVVFEGGTVVSKGGWPVAGSPLARTLD